MPAAAAAATDRETVLLFTMEGARALLAPGDGGAPGWAALAPGDNGTAAMDMDAANR